MPSDSSVRAREAAQGTKGQHYDIPGVSARRIGRTRVCAHPAVHGIRYLYVYETVLLMRPSIVACTATLPFFAAFGTLTVTMFVVG